MFNFKNKFARITMSIAAFTCAFFTQSAFAISTIPTTGTCGFVISGSFPFIGVQLNGSGTSALGALNWLGTLDFGSNTLKVNVVSQTATGATGSVPNPTFVNSQVQYSVPFTVSGPTNGIYALNFGASNGSMNLIPVNGGATLLMQQFISSDAGGKAGVCQF